MFLIYNVICIMSLLLKDIADGILCNGLDHLDQCEVTGVRFYREDNRVEMDLHNDSILPFASYSGIAYQIENITGSKTVIHVSCDHPAVNAGEIRNYLSYFARIYPDYALVAENVFTYDSDKNTIRFLMNDELSLQQASAYLNGIEEYLKSIGCKDIHAECVVKEPEQVQV